MAFALAIFVFWILLSAPIGLLVHRLIVPPSVRTNVIPLAPLTGLATMVLVAAAATRLSLPLAGTFTVVAAGSAVSAFALRRLRDNGLTWLIVGVTTGAIALGMLIVAIFAGYGASGPFGYDTHPEAVAEVEYIDQMVDGASRTLAQSDSFIGFESFAGATAAIGAGEWSPLTIHPTLVLLIAALCGLPALVLARARLVRWPGSFIAVALAVSAPPLWVAISPGSGAVMLAALFAATAITFLLILDSAAAVGVLAVISAAALLVVAGPVALLPVAVVAALYVALVMARDDDTPTVVERMPRWNMPAVCGVTLVLAGIGAWRGIMAGATFSWQELTNSVASAMRVWPAVWLDERLNVAVPGGSLLDVVPLALGVTMIAIVAWYAIRRNDALERATVIAIAGAWLVGVGAGLAGGGASGARIVEWTVIALGPALAVLVVRAAGIARGATAIRGGKRWRSVPALVLFAIFSLAVVSTSYLTSSRLVQLPPLGADDQVRTGATLVLVPGPWPQSVFSGVRPPAGTYAGEASSDTPIDADALDADGATSLTYGDMLGVITSTNPFSSDPPGRFEQAPYGGPLPVRSWVDRRQDSTAGDADATAPAASALARLTPLRHDPVEAHPGRAGELGGVVIPSIPDPGTVNREPVQTPVVAEGSEAPACPQDVQAVGGAESGGFGYSTCIDVPLDARTTHMVVRVRELGLVLVPRVNAAANIWKPAGAAWPWGVATDDHDAVIDFEPIDDLSGDADLVLQAGSATITVEGEFGAGAYIGPSPFASPAPAADVGGLGATQQSSSYLVGSLAGASPVLQGQSLSGGIAITNSEGSHITVGRMTALVEPATLPLPCDIVLKAEKNAVSRIGAPLLDLAIAGGTSESESVDGTTGATANVLAPDAERPDGTRLQVSVIDVRGEGTERVATLLVTSALSTNDAPSRVLVDWTEQYSADPQVGDCASVATTSVVDRINA